MRVYIGPYRDYYSVYKFTDKLKYIGFSDCKCDNIGDYLAETYICKKFFSFVNSLFNQRSIEVIIDPYDTWSMDSTLGYIILPMLKQLKETKHGSPMVDDEDVPDNLKSSAAPPAEDWGTDDNVHLRWEYVLNEMIWAFEQVNSDWESQFSSGEFDKITIDITPDETDENKKIYRWEDGPNHTYKVDLDAREAHTERMQNGFRLFGKYYQGLWD